MRKLSKPALGIAIGIVIMALLLSIMIGFVMKNSHKKARMSQLDISKTQNPNKKPEADKSEGDKGFVEDTKKKDSSTVDDVIKKEQKMLKEGESGGYIGGVGVSKKKKDVEPDIENIIGQSGENILMPTMPKNEGVSIYNTPATAPKMGQEPAVGGDPRRQAWEYLYVKKASGGFIGKAQPVGQVKDAGVNKADSANGKPAPKVQFFRPYRATIDRTFTSAQPNATFVATASEPPIRGWKIIGKAGANFSDNRFHVDLTGFLSPDNISYAAKGYVSSVDESDGIISAVKHDDITGSITSGLLAGASSFFNALRKDTTTVEVGSGGTVITGQTKTSDREREAGLAAGDTVFQGLSKKVEGSIKRTPTLIMEKGVPVLVYFTP